MGRAGRPRWVFLAGPWSESAAVRHFFCGTRPRPDPRGAARLAQRTRSSLHARLAAAGAHDCAAPLVAGGATPRPRRRRLAPLQRFQDALTPGTACMPGGSHAAPPLGCPPWHRSQLPFTAGLAPPRGLTFERGPWPGPRSAGAAHRRRVPAAAGQRLPTPPPKLVAGDLIGPARASCGAHRAAPVPLRRVAAGQSGAPPRGWPPPAAFRPAPPRAGGKPSSARPSIDRTRAGPARRSIPTARHTQVAPGNGKSNPHLPTPLRRGQSCAGARPGATALRQSRAPPGASAAPARRRRRRAARAPA
jgi:hypothetical protein